MRILLVLLGFLCLFFALIGVDFYWRGEVLSTQNNLIALNNYINECRKKKLPSPSTDELSLMCKGFRKSVILKGPTLVSRCKIFYIDTQLTTCAFGFNGIDDNGVVDDVVLDPKTNKIHYNKPLYNHKMRIFKIVFLVSAIFLWGLGYYIHQYLNKKTALAGR